MKNRYWLIQHRGIYYALDSHTKKKASLRTRNKSEAQRLIAAKNETDRQPQLNLALARTYLAAHDSRQTERTWREVMAEFCTHGKSNSQDRSRRAVRSRDFDAIRDRKLVETTSDDLLAVLKSGGAATNNYLRRLHNLALGLGWLAWPVLAPKLWPKPTPKPKRGITAEEHRKLVESTAHAEWRLFLELLWETGAAQSDAANLCAENVDWKEMRLIYHRRKLKEIYAPAVIRIGSRLEAILRQLPKEGFLFPKIQKTSWNHRSAEFYRKCKVLKIAGVSLHSYRYAWAERAKAAGYPERWAQANLGHNSRAVHQSYAKRAFVECPSLEEYEEAPRGKILPMPKPAPSKVRKVSG
jgi:integrase